MASALEQSRALLAHGVARIRAGFDAYGRGLDRPGPEIPVEPFDAHNVSTPAALIKLGTSIAAARRHRANYGQAREMAKLEQEKTRAEIAHLRAQAAYDLGTGRQAAPPATPAGSELISQGQYKGWSVRDASADLADRRAKQSAQAHADVEKRTGRLSAAQAKLRAVDAEAGRVGEALATSLEPSSAFVQQAFGKDPTARNATLSALGIEPTVWESMKDNAYGQQQIVNQALINLRARNKERALAETRVRYEPLRRSAQSVIDQGLGADAGTGIDEGDDPLGIYREQ